MNSADSTKKAEAIRPQTGCELQSALLVSFEGKPPKILWIEDDSVTPIIWAVSDIPEY